MAEVSPATPPAADPLLGAIADYVLGYRVESAEAWDTARLCLFDALGCALEALSQPECVKLLGPVVPGTIVPHGARVPGTSWQLDPVQAAFALGTMIRWLDFNDTWLAAEWGHPSDNLGGLLATADWLSRSAVAAGKPPLLVRELLHALIQAYEIQGVLALENAFNRVGLDHVLLVKVASTATVARLLGLSREDIIAALSQAWIDGHPLRIYRQGAHTGWRKSWAAGDATSRAVRLALLTRSGEGGYPAALSAPTWGFCEVLFRGQPVRQPRPFGTYVIENILFKVAWPVEFHAQTAVEAALQLHPQVRGRWGDIRRILIRTQEAASRIIDKRGPLRNPADRDHCLQYAVAVALVFGRLTADDYQEEVAADPRLEALRARMEVVEDPQFTRDYFDPQKRSIANAVRIEFQDGRQLPEVVVEYPLGHRRRRAEALPLLWAKFQRHLSHRLPARRQQAILDLAHDPLRLENTPVHEFVDLFVI
jgi:2-methylcitrate dehydratase